jgi:hypothetical protein
MKALEYFIRIRVNKDDRLFIEKYVLENEITISDLFRDLIKKMRS